MKKSELRKTIKEEISKVLSEEDNNYRDQIDRSLEQIEAYLYYMPDQNFAKVMKRWFSEFSGFVDKESRDMLLGLEKSLKEFDDVLNFKNNRMKNY